MLFAGKRFLVFLFCLLTVFQARAEDDTTVVMESPDVKITVGDLRAAIAGMPLSRRNAAWSSEQNLRAIAENLLIWRTLAAIAEEKKILDDPLYSGRVVLEREKTLGTIMLELAEGEIDPKAVEDLARLEYQARPEQFTQKGSITASHILVGKKGRSEEEGKQLATDLLARLNKGEDFATLAREYSDDKANAQRGGSLGQIKRGRLVPAFEEALYALKQPGDLSDLVLTEFGYHIIRLDERTEDELKPFDSVRDQLIQGIEQRLRNERRQSVVDPIRDTSRVTTYSDVLGGLTNTDDGK